MIQVVNSGGNNFYYNIIHLMSDPERNSFVFPRVHLGKHQDLRENKTNWFPEGPNISVLLHYFLDFYFNILQQQQKNMLKRSESKQATRYL